MSLDYIRKTYSVPAFRGRRIRYRSGPEGVITGSNGAYLRVKLDGDNHPGLFHPTWKIEYLPQGKSEGMK
jgi:hypothetical protein